jgi:hypothetical protein
LYTPQDLKIEKLEDGFLLTFTNKGGMGTNYWLTGRRTHRRQGVLVLHHGGEADSWKTRPRSARA